MRQIDKGKVAKHFSLSAQTYDHATPVQQSMSERLLQSVAESYADSDGPEKILEIGCGTGYLTHGLSSRYPDAEITALDISEAMAHLTSQRCPWAEVINIDAEDYLSATQLKYDLVISNATFQWFSDPHQAVLNAHACLKAGGLFALASFGQNTFHELRQSFNHAYERLNLDKQAHVVEMIDVNRLRESYLNAHVEEFEINPTFESVRSFLKSIQAAGAVNAQRHSASMRRDVYKLMSRFYEQQFSHDTHGISVTYHAFNMLLPAYRGT